LGLGTGGERDFVARSVAHHQAARTRSMTAAEQASFQHESQVALRATLARLLLGESLRGFSCHLAESAVLQRFCALDAPQGWAHHAEEVAWVVLARLPTASEQALAA